MLCANTDKKRYRTHVLLSAAIHLKFWTVTQIENLEIAKTQIKRYQSQKISMHKKSNTVQSKEKYIITKSSQAIYSATTGRKNETR